MSTKITVSGTVKEYVLFISKGSLINRKSSLHSAIKKTKK